MRSPAIAVTPRNIPVEQVRTANPRRGDLIVVSEGTAHEKRGLYVGLRGVDWVCWDSTNPESADFAEMCRTFDGVQRDARRPGSQPKRARRVAAVA